MSMRTSIDPETRLQVEERGGGHRPRRHRRPGRQEDVVEEEGGDVEDVENTTSVVSTRVERVEVRRGGVAVTTREKDSCRETEKLS